MKKEAVITGHKDGREGGGGRRKENGTVMRAEVRARDKKLGSQQ
jgi:hypothetical protein